MCLLVHATGILCNQGSWKPTYNMCNIGNNMGWEASGGRWWLLPTGLPIPTCADFRKTMHGGIAGGCLPFAYHLPLWALLGLSWAPPGLSWGFPGLFWASAGTLLWLCLGPLKLYWVFCVVSWRISISLTCRTDKQVLD